VDGERTSSVSLSDIESAAERIKLHAIVTPLLRQHVLDAPEAKAFYLKAENLQRTGAFKFRGAFNTLASLSTSERERGVVTSSSGNHGQAIAASAQILGIEATVVMPENAVATKVDAVRRFGGTVVFAGTTSLEREEVAQSIGHTDGRVVLGSFDDARIIAGQGTAGREIMQQCPDIDVVIVPVGGGGLISGIASAVKEINPTVRVIGAEPSGASDAYQSLEARKIITASKIDTIADGLRTSRIGKLNFAIMSRLVDQIVLVDDDELKTSMRRLAEQSKLVVEPSGAIAVAAAISDRFDFSGLNVAAVISGGNVDPRLFVDIVGQA
jgi:threonine dehydratase